MAPATIIYYSKFFIKHDHQDDDAVIEIKVWEVFNDIRYPEGVKYSLFCVDLETNEVIVGLDNHFPKGHHVHIDNQELHYFFEGVEKLVDDFYSLLNARGYTL
jgi:hypothetical protein